MSEKIILVTGASSGIGKEAAVQFAQRGARVVMVCRNRERGEPARDDVKARSGREAIELLTADLGAQRQIHALADAFLRTHDRLDALVHIAGLFMGARQETEDGIEVTWAVNHLAPFLLTHRLLDVLKASAPARVVVVSSEAHQNGTLRFDDLGMAQGYAWMDAYRQSKLANVLFTYELARRLAGTGVTATCLHPGVVATNLFNRNKGLVHWGLRLLKPFLLSPQKGAEALVRLAVDPAVEGLTGVYFDRMTEKACFAPFTRYGDRGPVMGSQCRDDRPRCNARVRYTAWVTGWWHQVLVSYLLPFLPSTLLLSLDCSGRSSAAA